ncbi:2,3-diaminopropionate biosynthesis protein SbnA [Bacillus mycoides]|uniref:2,3-diaminopropionate biosynthesis protein SbnA n=1 Tax=Bacillus mycoides TaxID=1405 RepID=UPI0035560F26
MEKKKMKNYKVNNSILDLVGSTPLMLLEAFSDNDVRIFAKIEGFNPGGSMKDRPGLNMINIAEEKGILKPGGRIIESSSGNLGIALAMIGAVKGYQVHCVVDPRISTTNLKIMRAYGATIDMVSRPDNYGGYQQARIDRVKELLEVYEDAYWPNQYDNKGNPEAHYKGTAFEIYNALGEDIDYLVIPVSSAGLVTGCGLFVKKHIKKTKIIAVDAKGSTIFGGCPSARRMTGIGGNVTPPNLKRELIDEVFHVNDDESVQMCEQIIKNESLLVGPSSGAALFTALKLKGNIKGKKNIVVIFPDNGDRYLDGLLDVFCSKSNRKVNIENLAY